MATTVKNGSKGADVKNLQTQLNSLGYNLAVDGVFGKNTLAAVRDYQGKNGLTVDGIVGKNTWNSLLGNSAGNVSGSSAQANTTATGVTQQTGPTANNSSSTSSKTTTTIKSYNQPYTAPTYTAPEAYKEPEAYNAPTYQADEYVQSPAVIAAFEKLQQAQTSKPGEYQSRYTQQLDDIMNQILNYKDFNYDLNSDMLYQQYKQQYDLLGRQAMRDTMGNAAALSGGYGNSYASTVGNQAYQNYLQQLNDRVPELYQLARDNYDRDRANLTQNYGILSDRENLDYNRYRDLMADYYNDVNLANDMYRDERNFDWNQYTDTRDFGYNQYINDRDFGYNQWLNDRNNAYEQYLNDRNFDYSRFADDRDFGYNQWLQNRNFEYQQERDNAADNQWQTSFDEDRRRYDQEWAYQLQQAAQAVSGGGGSGSGGRSSSRRSSGGNGSGSGNPGENADMPALKSASSADLSYARAAYALYGDNAGEEIARYAERKGIEFSDADLAQIEKDVKLKQAQVSNTKRTASTSNAGGVSNLTKNTRTKNYLK